MDFARLEKLRQFLSGINSRQVSSLECYYDKRSNGFYHRHDKKVEGKFSKSSTATCVLSLAATDNWKAGPWAGAAEGLAKAMLHAPWSSAKLQENNVFTVAWTLEAVAVLRAAGESVTIDAKDEERIREGEALLLKALQNGAASIDPYPPSGYLTQLAVRTLRRWDALTPETSECVQTWAWREINRQLALLKARSRTADPFQLAYSIMLVSTLGEPSGITPDENQLLHVGLNELFARQLKDGTWPRSQPLFHYPDVGNAYCYEYEMLAQLLDIPRLADKSLRHLPSLSKAAYALSDNAFQLGNNANGWSSGHHPQLHGPESWSTASVFHFAHTLDRLLAEEIRRTIFADLNAPYTLPQDPKQDESKFAPGFLDVDINTNLGVRSLRQVLFEHFVRPIASNAKRISGGSSLSPDTPTSAIIFGPPGTSKTELARHIAEYLQWPLLVVDPSHFVRNGMDQVQAEADRLFGMLKAAERIVVLLDEFDEMVRERERATEVLSRFLTTTMLPKLAAINKSRKIVFLVATNNLHRFDLAVSRLGRFDMILPVMPPKGKEKLRKWPNVAANLAALSISVEGPLAAQVDALTYDEFRMLAPALGKARTPDEALGLISDAYGRCTLNAPTDPEAKPKDQKTWAKLCDDQKKKIRIPPFQPGA